MNKKELLLLLADVPDDAEVIMSSDAEGNKYSPISFCEYPSIYVLDTKEVYISQDSEDDTYWEKEKKEKTAVDAVVLYPTN